jgi:HAD superfamily hydrolase (TIGR01549 family)
MMNSPATPDFLYFDLGNVLLLFDHEKGCHQVSELTGLPATKVRQVIFENGLNHRYERGEISSKQFYDEFCTATNTTPDYESLLVAGSDIFELNLPMVPVIAQLNAAGYAMGLLSNTCEAHWQFIAGGRFSLLNNFFPLHVLSYEAKCSKPDQKIYQTAAKRAGMKPEQVFYVDDREENVLGAREAGFDAVLFEGPQQLAIDLRKRGLRFNY